MILGVPPLLRFESPPIIQLTLLSLVGLAQLSGSRKSFSLVGQGNQMMEKSRREGREELWMKRTGMGKLGIVDGEDG